LDYLSAILTIRLVNQRFPFSLVVATSLLLPAPTRAASDESAPLLPDHVHRILVLGDSITYSGQYVDDLDAYFATRFPARRIELLNLGLPSETVSGLSEEGHADGKFPRPDLHERLGRVLDKTKPDLVLACYGMNDGIYLPFNEERFQKFKDGTVWLHDQVTAAGAKIIHVTPPTFDEVKGGHAGYSDTLDRYANWLMAQRAAGWDVVDIHFPMNRYLAERRQRDPGYFLAGDGVHCNDTGHWIMAKQILLHLGALDVANADYVEAMLAPEPHGNEIFKLVQEKQRLLKDAWLTDTGHKRPGMNRGLPLAEAEARAATLDDQIHKFAVARPESEAAPFPGRRSEWQGFDRYDFAVNGKSAIVVVPKQALPGRPWAWRGEFFGAFANADAALVAKGFHLAYLGVPDLFGSPKAVKDWDEFYAELTGKYGLAKKVALIGLSRGGLYCYNWAVANPDKVACIYADAPVCDFKSWPGGKLIGLGTGDGSAAEWVKLLKAYDFKSDAEAIAYRGNPVDNLKPLADAKIPLLHVYGDADTGVPWQENTGVIARRYKALGADITLIPKPGVGHHPHGLEDPTPIVDFILKHAAATP
jgi:lysophospholipase L1-like esterase/pimeloyl-ACP methyl ester carboxylesterase